MISVERVCVLQKASDNANVAAGQSHTIFKVF